MKELRITGKKLRKLEEEYRDCINLKKKKDLTPWGKGEFYILNILPEPVRLIRIQQAPKSSSLPKEINPDLALLITLDFLLTRD